MSEREGSLERCLGRVESKVDNLQVEMKGLNTNFQEIKNNQVRQGQELVSIEKGFENHLKHHDKYWKILSFVIATFVASVAIVVALMG